jgi:predicted S18 family serine protease
MSHLKSVRHLGALLAVVAVASLTAGSAVAQSGSHRSPRASSAAEGAPTGKPARVKPGVGPGQGTGVRSLGPAPGAGPLKSAK